MELSIGGGCSVGILYAWNPVISNHCSGEKKDLSRLEFRTQKILVGAEFYFVLTGLFRDVYIANWARPMFCHMLRNKSVGEKKK